MDRLENLSKRLIQSRGRVESVKMVDEFYEEPVRDREASTSPPHEHRSNSNPKSAVSYKNELSDYSKHIWNDVPTLINTAYRARTNVNNSVRQGAIDSIHTQRTDQMDIGTDRIGGISTPHQKGGFATLEATTNIVTENTTREPILVASGTVSPRSKRGPSPPPDMGR